MTDPFASKIAAAEQREAAAKAKLLAAAKTPIPSKPAKTEAELLAEYLIKFGQGFLFAVANKVVREDRWSPEYISRIRAYAMALLSKFDCELPKIDPRHVDQILDKFEYGLWLNPDVPDGTFFGQRLLAERANQAVRPASIRYARPALVTDEPLKAAASVTAVPPAQLPPAITPKGVRGGRKANVA